MCSLKLVESISEYTLSTKKVPVAIVPNMYLSDRAVILVVEEILN